MFSIFRKIRTLIKKFLEAKKQAKKVGDKLSLLTFGKYLRLYFRYKFTVNEFFYYNFKNKTLAECGEFCTEITKNKVCRKLNTAYSRELFNDKYAAYRLFTPYFHREIIKISAADDTNRKKFYEFVSKRSKVAVKPFNSSLGNGFRFIEHVEDNAINSLFDQLVGCYESSFLLEEAIVQCPEMAALHPSSLNTVRITTLRLNDRTALLYPFLRVGQGGAIVDNGGAGGILCPLDLETGKILKACDENLKRYDYHPQSQIPLIGFQVPRWQEAKTLALELADVAYSLSDCRYVGWDLGLTDEGWTLIEGNSHGQFVGWQLTLNKGFYRELRELLKEINLDLDKIACRKSR